MKKRFLWNVTLPMRKICSIHVIKIPIVAKGKPIHMWEGYTFRTRNTGVTSSIAMSGDVMRAARNKAQRSSLVSFVLIVWNLSVKI